MTKNDILLDVCNFLRYFFLQSFFFIIFFFGQLHPISLFSTKNIFFFLSKLLLYLLSSYAAYSLSFSLLSSSAAHSLSPFSVCLSLPDPKEGWVAEDGRVCHEGLRLQPICGGRMDLIPGQWTVGVSGKGVKPSIKILGVKQKGASLNILCWNPGLTKPRNPTKLMLLLSQISGILVRMAKV